MVRIAPAPSRVTIQREPGVVRAVTRLRRKWGVGLFLLAWLCGWAFGEVAAIREVATRAHGAGLAFLLFWLAAWTLGGGFVALQVLASFAGRQEIAVGPRTLSVRTYAGPFRRTREDDLAAVRELVESGRLSLDNLITHREPALTAASAYRTAFEDPSCLKMVLDWRSVA